MAKEFDHFVKLTEPLPFQAAVSRIRRDIAAELRLAGDERGAHTEEALARRNDDDRICAGLLSHSQGKDEERYGSQAVAQFERYKALQEANARKIYRSGDKEPAERIGPKTELPAFAGESVVEQFAARERAKLPGGSR